MLNFFNFILNFRETLEDMKKKTKDEVKNSDSLAKLKKKINEKREERRKIEVINVNSQETKKQFSLYDEQRVNSNFKFNEF